MSKVLFVDSRSWNNVSLLDKFSSLIEKSNLDFIKPKQNVAIKLHMGERGNTAFIRPMFVRRLVDKIKDKGAYPFLTDTTTLYHGPRSNPIRLMEVAYENGFSYATVNAPIIVGDGIRSSDKISLSLDCKNMKNATVSGSIIHSDAIIVFSHFKMHVASAFGGALKNLGMGIATRATKQILHANVKPKMRNISKCTKCYDCLKSCAHGAISVGENGHPVFSLAKCIGCAECITACFSGALEILWNESPLKMSEKVAEVCLGVLKNKGERLHFFNFLIDITPDCDCMNWSDNPIVQNIGILSSNDPVAIDSASCELVNQAEGLRNSALKNAFASGSDKILDLRSKINWEAQLHYAESLGLGSTKYVLEKIELN